GAISGPPRQTNERPGFAGVLRALGVWGPYRGPHVKQTSAPASPGCSERWGCGGHIGAPTSNKRAPRLRRGAPSAGGVGAISGPPRQTNERPGFAGVLRALGVWGPYRGP